MMTTKLLKKSPQILAALLVTLFVSTEATAAPVAHPDRVNTSVGVPQMVGVLWNDRGRGIYVSKVNNHSARGGRVYVAGGKKVYYTPKAGFSGTDTFWYQITDANGRKNSSKVVVNVRGGHQSASGNSYLKPVHHWQRRNHWQKQKWQRQQWQKRQHWQRQNWQRQQWQRQHWQRQNWQRQQWQRQNYWRNYNKPSYNLQWSKPGFSINYSKPGGLQAQINVPQPHYAQPKSNWQPRWGQGGGTVVGRPDAYSVQANSAQMPLWVLANDQGSGLKVLKTNQWTQQGGTAWVMNDQSGSYVMYKPKPGFVGVDTLWYVLRDANGRTSSTKATVTVY